jgi:predicted Zn-dependent peptidase
MEVQEHTLANGLRIVHKPTANGQVAHLGITINAGSRDEREDEQGLAHFIEHCLFKGTKRRKAFHILTRMDSVGAELNAYTTKEETVIYASFLNSHFQRAMEVVADIVCHSTFPEKELAKERDVIIDEIMSYQDSPAELIFDDFEELLYGTHPLGRNILGTRESVAALSRDHILHFLKRRYRTAEMVLSTAGHIDFRKIVKWAERYFGDLPPGAPDTRRMPIGKVHIERREVELDTFQAHLMIGGTAPDNHHPLRSTAILLNNYLGGPAMNSRLNMNIRERHGIAYNIESGYTPYSDTGVISIYLGTDKKLLARSERLVYKELLALRQNKLSPTALHRAKEQLKGQLALASEGGANLMQALGKSLLNHGRIDTTEEILREIDGITAEQALEVANQCFEEDKMAVLVYR